MSAATPRAVVLTASFGRHSPEPARAAVAAGITLEVRSEHHPATPEQAAEQIGDAPAVIVGLDRIDASVFAACPNLRVVAKHGVGVDNIDLDAARRAGVAVVNAPGANAIAVADLTLGLILAGARRIVEADASVRAGRWEVLFGTELAGRTLSILGFGRIGREVATRALAFGMRVLAYDPFVPEDQIRAAGVEPATLETAVPRADVLSLHLPLPADGRALIDAALLATLPEGAGVINAARGGLVDEEALAGGLRSGRIGFAGIDALSVEPPESDHPLLGAPRVILTPHLGAFTDGANAAMGTLAVGGIADVLAGREPAHRVA